MYILYFTYHVTLTHSFLFSRVGNNTSQTSPSNVTSSPSVLPTVIVSPVVVSGTVTSSSGTGLPPRPRSKIEREQQQKKEQKERERC